VQLKVGGIETLAEIDKTGIDNDSDTGVVEIGSEGKKDGQEGFGNEGKLSKLLCPPPIDWNSLFSLRLNLFDSFWNFYYLDVYFKKFSVIKANENWKQLNTLSTSFLWLPVTASVNITMNGWKIIASSS